MITKQQLGNTLRAMAEILYDNVEDYTTYILSLPCFSWLPAVREYGIPAAVRIEPEQENMLRITRAAAWAAVRDVSNFVCRGFRFAGRQASTAWPA